MTHLFWWTMGSSEIRIHFSTNVFFWPNLSSHNLHVFYWLFLPYSFAGVVHCIWNRNKKKTFSLVMTIADWLNLKNTEGPVKKMLIDLLFYSPKYSGSSKLGSWFGASPDFGLVVFSNVSAFSQCLNKRMIFRKIRIWHWRKSTYIFVTVCFFNGTHHIFSL